MSTSSNPSPKQIKEARAAAKLSQAEAAALIGYSRRAWQEWEAGRRKMRASLMTAFKVALAQYVLMD